VIRLVGTDGDRFYSWELKDGSYLIGRKPDCDIHIPHKTVSRRHAKIRVNISKNSYSLTDLGSHNGTLVNGERISGSTDVQEGDAIMFGQTEFRITAADDSKASSPTLPKTLLSDHVPENSVFLSIDEALKPLPKRITDRPELLPTLFEMAKMLVLTEPKEMLLQRSLKMISAVIPADRLAVLSVSDDGKEVYTEACLYPGEVDPGELTLSRTIANQIMTNKNATLITDARNDPRFAEQKSILASSMKSAIAVPLFDEGKVLGILYADTSNPLHQYTDEYLRVMATFGNILASRLLNYELLHEREEKQVIQRELRAASAIQKALLKTNPPQIPGYVVHAFQEQSQSVGGDLYDVKCLNDGRLLFLVADVSGKGLGAALLMSNILASFRILYESEQFDLAKAVQRVSVQLFNYSAPGDFATLFIALLDPGSGKLRYVNAGHNPPLVVRKQGEVEYLPPCGMMIGAFDFPFWDEQYADLADGDLVFVFTDGVTEADRGEEQYGEKRMERLVAESRAKDPLEIASALLEDINKFIGNAPRSDDITMLLVKRESK
jgi:serine phosphatase RsbU (regulator of sigma subunit)